MGEFRSAQSCGSTCSWLVELYTGTYVSKGVLGVKYIISSLP